MSTSNFKSKCSSRIQNYKKLKSSPLFLHIQIHRSLFKKYSKSEYTYESFQIRNLIFNEKCHLVAKFKDYLVYDDDTEFIRRFYKKNELKIRLPQILNFYGTYSKIFPNYMILPENVYLYRNIRKKQKMIDAFNQIKREEEENRINLKKGIHLSKYNQNANVVFSKDVQKSINRFQQSNIIDNSNFCYFNNDNNDFEDSQNSISISLLSKKGFGLNNLNNANSNHGVTGKEKLKTPMDSMVFDDSVASLAMIVQGINNPVPLMGNETPKKNTNLFCNYECNYANNKVNGDYYQDCNVTPKKLNYNHLSKGNEDSYIIKEGDSIQHIHSSLNNNRKFISHKLTASLPEMNNNIDEINSRSNKVNAVKTKNQFSILNNYHNIKIKESSNAATNVNNSKYNFPNNKSNTINMKENNYVSKDKKNLDYKLNIDSVSVNGKTSFKKKKSENIFKNKITDSYNAKNNNPKNKEINKSNLLNNSKVKNKQKLDKSNTKTKSNKTENTMLKIPLNQSKNKLVSSNRNEEALNMGKINNSNSISKQNNHIGGFNSPEKLINTKLSLSKNKNYNKINATTSTVSHMIPFYKNKNMTKPQAATGMIQNRINPFKLKLEIKKVEKSIGLINNSINSNNVNSNATQKTNCSNSNLKKECVQNSNQHNLINKISHVKILSTENDLTVSKSNTTANNLDTNISNINVVNQGKKRFNDVQIKAEEKIIINHNNFNSQNNQYLNHKNCISTNFTTANNKTKNNVSVNNKSRADVTSKSKDVNSAGGSKNVEGSIEKKHKQLSSVNYAESNEDGRHNKNISLLNSQRKAEGIKSNFNRKIVLSPNNNIKWANNICSKIPLTTKIKMSQKSPINRMTGGAQQLTNKTNMGYSSNNANKIIKNLNQKAIDPNSKKMKFITSK